jgi:glycogen phosphorylase
MSSQSTGNHPIYNLLPTEIEGVDSLAELALDMRWSWNHATDGIWRTLDPTLWDLTQNPWVVLQTASHDRIKHTLADLPSVKILMACCDPSARRRRNPLGSSKSIHKRP